MGAKKAWCCVHHHVGCPTTECQYDCNAGFSNWQRGWSEGKKVFCCSTQGKGCPPTSPPTPPPPPPPTTTLPYDCNAGWHGCYHCLLKMWSVSKLAWCCAHMGRGCPTAAPMRWLPNIWDWISCTRGAEYVLAQGCPIFRCVLLEREREREKESGAAMRIITSPFNDFGMWGCIVVSPNTAVLSSGAPPGSPMHVWRDAACSVCRT